VAATQAAIDMKRYFLKIGEAETAALKILADSPRGASAYHLVTRHGVAPSAIFNIVEMGLADHSEQELGGHTFKVTWVQISSAGRATLHKQEARPCAVE
jgi:hypothetical protein